MKNMKHMKHMKIMLMSIFLTVFLLFYGCAGKPINLNSTNSQVEHTNINFNKGREITASASGFQLLLFIPIQINTRHQRAQQLLEAAAGGRYITDTKIQESWTYAFVGTVYTTTLKATVYPSTY